ncbi:hypothetical protein [Aeromonas hydrophila]|uniref:hypothetical protein n=1 Tax=Aeromonas hydrophila TaxID=644 RepID=UPI001115F6E9|nr:hypothetical protein [Aeromonas hydrophila]
MYAPDWLNGNDTRPNLLAVTMPNQFFVKKQIIKIHPHLHSRHAAQQVAWLAHKTTILCTTSTNHWINGNILLKIEFISTPSPINRRSLTEERHLANQSAGDHRLSSLADDKQKHNWDRAVKNRAAWQPSPALS